MSKKSRTSDKMALAKKKEAEESALAVNDIYQFDNHFDPFSTLNINNINNTTDDQCCTKNCCLKLCRQFITFLISRVGLLIAMVGYVLLGGVIFEQLEKEHELRALRLGEQVMEQMLARIYKQIETNSTRIKDDTFYSFLNNEIRSGS
jgi:hypothetical protein